MSEPTHAELVAAVEGARYPGSSIQPDFLVRDRDAHLNTLAAVLEVHHEIAPIYLGRGATCACDDRWPCPTVEVVADALRRMGAL